MTFRADVTDATTKMVSRLIVAIEDITALFAGETDTLRIHTSPPPKGATVAVQKRPGAHRSATVRILDVAEHPDGGHTVKVGLVARPHTPKLLARQAGKLHPAQYTSSTVGALPDEPECVDSVSQRRIIREAKMLDSQRNVARRLEHEARLFLERAEEAVMEAERLGFDGRREMARLEAGLAKLERRLVLERQQRRGKVA